MWRYGEVWMCRCGGGVEVQRCRGTEVQRFNGAEVVQRCRGAEES
jgi:hypothetical protein